MEAAEEEEAGVVVGLEEVDRQGGGEGDDDTLRSSTNCIRMHLMGKQEMVLSQARSYTGIYTYGADALKTWLCS